MQLDTCPTKPVSIIYYHLINTYSTQEEKPLLSALLLAAHTATCDYFSVSFMFYAQTPSATSS